MLKNWGVAKAKRDEKCLAKIDSKAVLRSTGMEYNKRFTHKHKPFGTTYYDFRDPIPKRQRSRDSDSDDSDHKNEENQVKAPLQKCSTQQNLNRLPIIPKKVAMHKPKFIDFSSNIEEMNANQVDENGRPHFDLVSADDRLLTLSPSQEKRSKMREYYNSNLWSHMHDFRHDKKTKINMIRKKYSKLLSPEVKLRRGQMLEPKAKEIHVEPPIIFARRDHNDRFRYEQMKEINALKDRLARDGISLDTNILKKAILMPEDIVN